MEDSALAGVPLASYGATQQETYRDPPTGPTVPNAMGQKRKCQAPHSFMFCSGLFIWVLLTSVHTNQTRQLHLFLRLFIFDSPCVHADHMFHLLEPQLLLLQCENHNNVVELPARLRSRRLAATVRAPSPGCQNLLYPPPTSSLSN